MNEKTKLEQRLLPFWRHPHKIIDQSSIHLEFEKKKNREPQREKFNESHLTTYVW